MRCYIDRHTPCRGVYYTERVHICRCVHICKSSSSRSPQAAGPGLAAGWAEARPGAPRPGAPTHPGGAVKVRGWGQECARPEGGLFHGPKTRARGSPWACWAGLGAPGLASVGPSLPTALAALPGGFGCCCDAHESTCFPIVVLSLILEVQKSTW